MTERDGSGWRGRARQNVKGMIEMEKMWAKLKCKECGDRRVLGFRLDDFGSPEELKKAWDDPDFIREYDIHCGVCAEADELVVPTLLDVERGGECPPWTDWVGTDWDDENRERSILSPN